MVIGTNSLTPAICKKVNNKRIAVSTSLTIEIFIKSV